MIKKLWHQIAAYRRSNPNSSIRQTSAALGVSKDTVYRQGKQTMSRRKFTESEFWESEAGQQFIKRLIVSAIYTFCIKGGLDLVAWKNL